MRKAEVFFDAITDIREDLIEAALDHRFAKQRVSWRRYASMAACLALVVLVGFSAMMMGTGGSSKSESAIDPGWDDAKGDTAVTEESASESEAPEQAEPSEKQESMPEESPTEDRAEEPAERFSFSATVLEIHENTLLVAPVTGQWVLNSADRFAVSVAAVESLPELSVGDEIVITFDGMIRETYPAQITALEVMRVVEKAETP